MADLRILLTDKTIARLPTPKDGWYLARDTELKGFFVVVGKRKRTFTVQGDLRQDGNRASSIRVAIGGTDEVSTRNARATAKEYLALISQDSIRRMKRGAQGPAKPKRPEIRRLRSWEAVRSSSEGSDQWAFAIDRRRRALLGKMDMLKG